MRGIGHGGDGPFGPSTESTHLFGDDGGGTPRRGYVLWTEDMVRRMQAAPERTAEEIAAMLGVSASSVRHARQRYGRFAPKWKVPLCQRCGAHPVWSESRDGKRWGLCRQCTLDERAYIARNGGRMARIDNAQRQARWKSRHK